MAIGVIELATIARSQDYATIKHHESAKVVTDQSHITAQVQKDANLSTKQVRSGEQPQWQGKKLWWGWWSETKETGAGRNSKAQISGWF